MYKFYKANKEIIIKILLYVVSVIAVLYFFPSQTKFKYDLKKGTIWNYENLYSPFDFPISKTEDEIKQEKKIIELNSRIYFDFIDEVRSNVLEDYENKFDNYFYDDDIITSERSLYFNNGLKYFSSIKSFHLTSLLRNSVCICLSLLSIFLIIIFVVFLSFINVLIKFRSFL